MIWVAAYVIGTLVTWRYASKWFLEYDSKIYYGYHRNPDSGDRAFALFIGFIIAVIWPLSTAFLLLKKIVFFDGLKTKDQIKKEKKEAEQEVLRAAQEQLDKLKKQAKEYGLPTWEV